MCHYKKKYRKYWQTSDAKQKVVAKSETSGSQCRSWISQFTRTGVLQNETEKNKQRAKQKAKQVRNVQQEEYSADYAETGEMVFGDCIRPESPTGESTTKSR